MRPTHACTVTAVHDVTPCVRRLVLGGPEAGRLMPPEGALGPYLKLHVPAGEGRALVRTYSFRRQDRARGTFEVDVVLHDAGPGSDLARRTAPGDVLRVGGPGHIPAAPCRAYLLAGDHTALPAIAHILESLPDRAEVRAVVEVPGPDEEQGLPSRADLAVTWLHRPPQAPSRLLETLRALWPRADSDLLVWAGAESAIARAIRCEARRSRGVPAARCQVLNYWKAGEPEGAFSYVE